MEEEESSFGEDLQQSAEEFEGRVKEESMDARIASLVEAGVSLVALGDKEKGRACLRSASDAISARKSSDAQDDREGKLIETLAKIHYNSAVASHALGDHVQAAKDYECFIEIREKGGDLESIVDALQALAVCYREAGENQDEVSSLEKAREVCKQLKDRGKEAIVCATLARTHLRTGREADCRRMLSTAKLLGLRADNEQILGLLYSQCGLVHTALGQHDEALRSFEHAFSLVKKYDGTESQEASLLQNIGATYNEKKMYNESLVYHREAASIHGRLENHEGEIRCLCNLAAALSQIKDNVQASDTLQRALERTHLVKNTELQFQVLELLGSCYYHMGQLSDAEEAFSNALKLVGEADTSKTRERINQKVSTIKAALLKDQMMSDTIALTEDAPSSPTYPIGLLTKINNTEQIGEIRATIHHRKEQRRAYEAAIVRKHESSKTLSSQAHALHLSSSFKGQITIAEGSLAIGQKARDMYSIQKSYTRSQNGQKSSIGKTQIAKQ